MGSETYQLTLVSRLSSATRMRKVAAKRRAVRCGRMLRSVSQSTHEVSSACHATMGQGVRFQWKGKMPSE